MLRRGFSVSEAALRSGHSQYVDIRWNILRSYIVTNSMPCSEKAACTRTERNAMNRSVLRFCTSPALATGPGFLQYWGSTWVSGRVHRNEFNLPGSRCEYGRAPLRDRLWVQQEWGRLSWWLEAIKISDVHNDIHESLAYFWWRRRRIRLWPEALDAKPMPDLTTDLLQNTYEIHEYLISVVLDDSNADCLTWHRIC